jgi:sporulation protein YlmC with PRC-barrel domain
MTTKIRQVLSSSSINGTTVQNMQRENLGEIKDLMIDIAEGRIVYAVLSFGGFLGMGDKLFAIPWEAFRVVQEEEVLLLDVMKEKLENAPGFDKDDWPDMADTTWGQGIHDYYGYSPYWNSGKKEIGNNAERTRK